MFPIIFVPTTFAFWGRGRM